MTQQKTKYRVVQRITETHWDGSHTVSESPLGDTYAVSKAQAVNNIRHRCGVREKTEYLYGDGSRITTIEAIPV